MKTVPILFTFDQSLLMPAGVCLTSLLESAEPDTFYDIFIIHGPGSPDPNQKVENGNLTVVVTVDPWGDGGNYTEEF